MNQEAFSELVRKAERAKTLVDEIKLLRAASPYVAGVQFELTKSGIYQREAILQDALLQQMLETGRQKLLADKEAELEAILNVPQKDADPLQPHAGDGKPSPPEILEFGGQSSTDPLFQIPIN